jgi:hypothetical protein
MSIESFPLEILKEIISFLGIDIYSFSIAIPIISELINNETFKARFIEKFFVTEVKPDNTVYTVSVNGFLQISYILKIAMLKCCTNIASVRKELF